MTTATILYGTNTGITFTISGLASSTGLLAGRESTAVDNTTDIAVDAMVGGKIVTATSAATTTATQIQVWAIGSYDGTAFTAGATGTDAGFTPDTGAKNLLRLFTAIPNVTTSTVTYVWGPYSVGQAFGGTMPKKWSLFVVQNTGQPLGPGCTTSYVTVKYQST